AIKNLQDNFNFVNPEKNVLALLEIRKLIDKVEDDFWKEKKLLEVNDLIYKCAGLFLEANTNISKSYPGGEFNLNLELINRSSLPISVENISIVENGQSLLSESKPLISNVLLAETTLISVDKNK